MIIADEFFAESSHEVVCFGDSITAMEWPGYFAERLKTETIPLRIVNEGIGGNKVLNDSPSSQEYGKAGIKRFRDDALSHKGVKYVIVLHGVNDIIHSCGPNSISKEVEAKEIISGLKQYIKWAHEKNVKIYVELFCRSGDMKE